MRKVEVQKKEEIKRAEDESRRHWIALFRLGAKLFPSDFLKEAKKLEKQTA